MPKQKPAAFPSNKTTTTVAYLYKDRGRPNYLRTFKPQVDDNAQWNHQHQPINKTNTQSKSHEQRNVCQCINIWNTWLS